MTTATAHRFWNGEWAGETDTRWLVPEPEVLAWIGTLAPDARVLDLGAGVGRHSLPLAAGGRSVAAFDAAPDGLARIAAAAGAAGLAVPVRQGDMTDLPYADGAFDHVLSWNVIYHGDRGIVARTIAEIARVLRPGGSFLGTMLSARRLPVERAKAPGQEISPGTWVFEGGGDKGHPHFFCDAAGLVALFDGFEPLRIEDREHDNPGSWHWHLVMERR